MVFIDIVLLVIIGAFVLFGLFFGFVHTLGSLAGTILGIIVASRFVDQTFDMFGFLLGGGSFARIVIFIVLFLLVSRVAGVALWLIEKVFKLFSIIPLAGLINRLLGGVLGLLEGIVVVGIVLFYSTQVLPAETLLAAIETSSIADFLLAAVNALQIFFPESLRISLLQQFNHLII